MNAFYDDEDDGGLAAAARAEDEAAAAGFLEGGDAPVLIQQAAKKAKRPLVGEIVPNIPYTGGHSVRKYPSVLKDDYENPYAMQPQQQQQGRRKRQAATAAAGDVHPVKVNYKSLQRVTATSKEYWLCSFFHS